MKLVVFDVDGTLTPIGSSWHYVHLVLGSRWRSTAYRKAFREGLISYEEWVYLDLSLWKGLDYRVFRKILLSIPWRKGVEKLRDLISKFKSNALFVAITCGFKELAERCVNELGFSKGIGVEVEVDSHGKLTGRAKSYISMWSKGEELKDFIEREGLSEGIDTVISVGDSPIDISLFESSDIAIAFCPSSELMKELDNVDVDIVIKSCSIEKLVKALKKFLQ